MAQAGVSEFGWVVESEIFESLFQKYFVEKNISELTAKKHCRAVVMTKPNRTSVKCKPV
jgi:hypothetical protein